MRTQKFLLAVCLSFVILISSIASAPAAPLQTSIPLNIIFDFVVDGLDHPLFATHVPGDSTRLFIVEKTGKIRIWNGATINATPFLDVSGLITNSAGEEQGLLGLAFDPDYANNGYFYIVYTNKNNVGDDTLARYHVITPATDNVADENSAQILLTVSEPEENHNGGMIAFGPDGYLYFGLGDGGGGGDNHGTIGNGQDKTTLLGKILRLDVNLAPPYTIPSTNPFFGSSNPSVKQEIWAYGVRNPWRFSFDRTTGDLYIGDVGQDTEEEIDFQGAGAAGGQNYGWRVCEGNLRYPAGGPCTSPPSGYVAPVATYDHNNDTVGCAVTGGYVYRGTDFPELAGVYLFGDYCTGNIWGLYKNASDQWVKTLIKHTDYSISSFAEDGNGELYILDYFGGQLIHITHAPIISNTFKSGAASDGSIRAASATSNMGRTAFPSDIALQVGDDSQGRHYKGILSFDTSSLPDTAVILSASLKILANGVYATKTIPYRIFGPIRIDMIKGAFGNNSTLTPSDYQAMPTKSNVSVFTGAPSAGWYSTTIPGSYFSYLNKVGFTQFRIYFASSNHIPLMGFSSGDDILANQPQLNLTYYVP